MHSVMMFYLIVCSVCVDVCCPEISIFYGSEQRGRWHMVELGKVRIRSGKVRIRSAEEVESRTSKP